MAINTKLETIKSGVLGVRSAIKAIDSSLANGTVDTLGNDIRNLNNRKYIWKWVNNNGTYELQKEVSNTDNVAANKYYNNSNIAAITLPDNIKVLNTKAFMFSGLDFIYGEGVTTLKGGNNKGTLQGLPNLHTVILPNVTTIEYNGLCRNYNLKTLILSKNLHTLGVHAFECTSYGPDCLDGYVIDFPNLNSIGSYAFQFTGIKSIQNLGTITTLPTYCFSRCYKLQSVTLPETLTTMGNRVFMGDSAVTTLTVLNPTPMSSAGFLSSFANLQKIYVPYGSKSSYDSATGWSAYATKIFELNEDGSIPT